MLESFDYTEVVREWAANSLEFQRPPPSSIERRRLNDENERDRQKIQQLEVAIAKRRALAAPIRILPIEILSEIFVTAVAMHDLDEPVDILRYRIRRTCRKWNAVCLATPQMWAWLDHSHDLHVIGSNECSLLEAVQEMISLSGASDLSISLCLSRHPFPKPDWMKFAFHPAECEGLTELIQTASRWKTLCLDGSTAFLQYIPPGIMHCMVELILIEHEDLNISGRLSDTIRLDMPSLRTLRVMLKNVFLPQFECPSLEVLQFDCPCISADSIMSLLKRVPSLRRLELKEFACDFNYDDFVSLVSSGLEGVTFLNMVYLKMEKYYSGPLTNVFGVLILQHCPHIREICMEFDSWSHREPLTACFPQVQKMTFRIWEAPAFMETTYTMAGRSSRKRSIRQWFGAFPKVKSLSISAGDDRLGYGTEIIDCLFNTRPQKGQSHPLPALTTLRLHQIAINGASLLNFSRRRTFAPHGTLKRGRTKALSPCLITLERCPGFPDIRLACVQQLQTAIEAFDEEQ